MCSDKIKAALDEAWRMGLFAPLVDIIRSGGLTDAEFDALAAAPLNPVLNNIDRKARACLRFKELRAKLSPDAAEKQAAAEYGLEPRTLNYCRRGKDPRVTLRMREIEESN